MIHVTLDRPVKKKWLWIPVILSLFAHLAFLQATGRMEKIATAITGPSQVDFLVLAPPPKEEPRPKIKPQKMTQKNTPKPNTTKSAPVDDPPKEENKPVFGATENSVTQSDSGVAVRVGNTLEKAMEKEYTDPTKIKPLPAQPVPLSELSRIPTFKNQIKPDYPENARRLGIEGKVLLSVLIDTTGRVQQVRILKEPGHGLGDAAVAAARQSLFHPGIKGGIPVSVRLTIPYRFVL